jgi:hypothetical protein
MKMACMRVLGYHKHMHAMMGRMKKVIWIAKKNKIEMGMKTKPAKMANDNLSIGVFKSERLTGVAAFIVCLHDSSIAIV